MNGPPGRCAPPRKNPCTTNNLPLSGRRMSIASHADHPVLRPGGHLASRMRLSAILPGPLSSVDDRFAWDEGEGDRTRAWWLDAHTRFFSRQCTAMGLTFSDDIGVVFERFELVWPAVRT